jgi:hypothetical protein
MVKLFSGLLSEYWLALLASDGPFARLAIQFQLMGLQGWAAAKRGL